MASPEVGAGGFVMLAKTFKGLTDAVLAWQTERLLQLAVRTSTRQVTVRSELIVEVAFDGVQTSPCYPAGLAHRWTRPRRTPTRSGVVCSHHVPE
jgi:DNA ligase-1